MPRGGRTPTQPKPSDPRPPTAAAPGAAAAAGPDKARGPAPDAALGAAPAALGAAPEAALQAAAQAHADKAQAERQLREAASTPEGPGEAPDRGYRPVVLVHGILGQPHLYWNLLARRLRRSGFQVVEVTLPYGLLGDLRAAARFLRDALQKVRRQHKADQVDVVAHSAGGLVARYYLRHLGGRKRVGTLVCLGTCHQGTYMAYALRLPMLQVSKQTVPGSSFLRELGDAEDGARIVNLWSPVDGIVVPAENAILPGAKNVRVGWTHHWAFLVSPRVHDRIAEELRRGNRPQKPGEDDADDGDE